MLEQKYINQLQTMYSLKHYSNIYNKTLGYMHENMQIHIDRSTLDLINVMILNDICLSRHSSDYPWESHYSKQYGRMHRSDAPDSYARLYHGEAEIIRKSHKQVGNYYHPTMYLYDD